MSGINKSSLKIILLIAMILPVLSFNLWMYLFRDWLLSNIFYLFTIWFIPVIFNKIFDVQLNQITKDWQNFKAFEPLHKKKSSLAFWIFVCFSLISLIITFFILRHVNYNVTVHAIFPLFDHRYLEFIYILLSLFMNVMIMPCLEFEYYFEIGYNSIENTFVGKLLVSLLFIIKYLLLIYYMLQGNHIGYLFIGIIKIFLIFFWISYIYSGEFKKETKIILSLFYLILCLNFLMLHYKEKLGFISPNIDWNNPNNMFNRIRDWRNSK